MPQKSFDINHGCSFILKPKDEQPAIRPYFNATIPPFWMHSVDKIKEDYEYMSIGMALQTSTHCREAIKSTGHICIITRRYNKKSKSKHSLKCTKELNEYLSQNESSNKKKDDEIKTSCLTVKKRQCPKYS